MRICILQNSFTLFIGLLNHQPKRLPNNNLQKQKQPTKSRGAENGFSE
jgi:hypothetical protein